MHMLKPVHSFCIALILTLLCGGAAVAAPAAEPVTFSVPPVDNVLDLHGDPANPQLVIFASGNQWMVMDDLIAAFKRAHPNVRRIFFETLPPGLEAQQQDAGGLQMGNLIINVEPDVIMAAHGRMTRLKHDGKIVTSSVYARNVLAILVRAGNPKNVQSLADLGRPDVRVVMPNPKIEGVARRIEAAFKNAGGDAMAKEIMETKLAAGTTVLTAIHHRQTPLFLIDGSADAGPVWLSEALYQEKIKAPLQTIRIPDKDNVRSAYEVAVESHARHAQAARAFAEFLLSPTAANIYKSYGFLAP